MPRGVKAPLKLRSLRAAAFSQESARHPDAPLHEPRGRSRTEQCTAKGEGEGPRIAPQVVPPKTAKECAKSD